MLHWPGRRRRTPAEAGEAVRFADCRSNRPAPLHRDAEPLRSKLGASAVQLLENQSDAGAERGGDRGIAGIRPEAANAKLGHLFPAGPRWGEPREAKRYCLPPSV